MTMNATRSSTCNISERILITTGELQHLLGCGRSSAVKLGIQAGACVEIGARVFWNPEKVREYLN